ncbi:hypothetical protein CLU79DRAFT_719238 [Phycomyces nitens]|nr:hypothetical protein CLU79DRAFT_719238 [Phycomyces nitens]
MTTSNNGSENSVTGLRNIQDTIHIQYHRYNNSKQDIIKNKGTIRLKRIQPRVSPSRWAEGKGYLDLYCDQEHIRSVRFTKKSNTGHQENQGLPAIYEGAPNRTV